MRRIVVDKDKDIFDYVVDFAIKQHNQPEEGFNYPEYWNISINRYQIKFFGANGRVYRQFKTKFNYVPDKMYTQILRWEKNNDKIEMAVRYYCQACNYKRKKNRYLLVNYILVNGELVFKCRSGNPDEPEKDSWRYLFEY